MAVLLLEKNLKEVKRKNKELAKKIALADVGDSVKCDYISVETSKTNKPIPVFNNGHLMYSKYNPEKEVASLFLPDDDFILFCGIGSGLQVEYFLKNYPEKNCAITDISFGTYKWLFSMIDFSKLIRSKRVRILPPITELEFALKMPENYQPFLDGKLRVVTLRTWDNFYEENLDTIKAIISTVLKPIETDFLTQVTFGKVWLKNILHNLQLLSTFKPSLPKIQTQKTALICGAGPSLSEKIQYIKNNRKQFVIFASDTSFLPLLESGINADVFLSVDPQIYSLSHINSALPKNTIGIFDLCALDILPRKFLQNGNNIFFTVSRHPLAKYALSFSAIPFANSSSGTVAIYALDVANSLGFTKFETIGMDFCYLNGKAYANGTYLHKKTQASCNKIFSTETFFTELMFRGNVEKTIDDKKITYKTEILNYYKRAADNYKFDGVVWKNYNFNKFPYESFFECLLEDLENKSISAYISMLPFFSYCKYHKKNNLFPLAIKSVLKYNSDYE